MPRNRKERAVYRVEQLLDWKYGDKTAHHAFAEMIVTDLTDSAAMTLPSEQGADALPKIGSPTQAINYALDKIIPSGEAIEFLSDWRDGALENYDDYRVWLDLCATAKADNILTDEIEHNCATSGCADDAG